MFDIWIYQMYLFTPAVVNRPFYRSKFGKETITTKQRMNPLHYLHTFFAWLSKSLTRTLVAATSSFSGRCSLSCARTKAGSQLGSSASRNWASMPRNHSRTSSISPTTSRERCKHERMVLVTHEANFNMSYCHIKNRIYLLNNTYLLAE